MALRAYDVSLWGFFRFLGQDAKTFLQGLVTADVTKLVPGVCLPACVLTPKGLLAADFELYEESALSLLAVTRPEAAVGFLMAFEKKIMLSESKLKALRSEQAWLVVGEGFSQGLPWTRLNEPARLLLGVDPPVDAELLSDAEFQALRIASGFPWFGADMNSESLPLEARQEAAISMEKGCYMGQETVSRIVFRGHVNKILMGLRGKAAPGDPIVRDGREIGRVTSASADLALASVRYEDAKPGLTGSGELFIFDSWPKPLS
ncbi:MAG: hypothetical protein HY923_02675 [Elusimicrobia bacterium]|nr:hypothetical protein [Elusimicrobiota bacterium]